MTIVLTMLVRDEQDVIAENIAYHLAQGVDHVIVTDNGSVDATREIADAFRRRGVVTLIDEPGRDYLQHRWVTRMARLAATEFAADWVINSDADEFWWPQEGDLRAVLGRVPDGLGGLTAKRVNFLPVREPPACPPRGMLYRDAASLNFYGLPLPGKTLHRGDALVEVGTGNHHAVLSTGAPSVPTGEIVIFHYPHRSYEQFARKIANGGGSLAANTEYTPDKMSHWRALYERALAGDLRAWYDALPHADDPQTLAPLLAAGTVVRDERLARYLGALGGS